LYKLQFDRRGVILTITGIFYYFTIATAFFFFFFLTKKVESVQEVRLLFEDIGDVSQRGHGLGGDTL